MLLALSVLIFILLRLTPGDPIDAYIDPNIPMSPEQLAELRSQLGLDKPLPVQYLAWLQQAMIGQSRLFDQASGSAGAGSGVVAYRSDSSVDGIGIGHRHYRRDRHWRYQRGAAQFAGRPLILGVCAGRHFEPGISQRADRPLCILRSPGMGAVRRHADTGCGIFYRRPAPSSDPARGASFHRPGRIDHALHARVAARSSQSGLCAHGARQGRQGILGHRQACVAQCAAAGRHGDRLDHRPCDRRRHLHRKRLQLAGHGSVAGRMPSRRATIRSSWARR